MSALCTFKVCYFGCHPCTRPTIRETTPYNYLLTAAQLGRYLAEYSPDPDADDAAEDPTFYLRYGFQSTGQMFDHEHVLLLRLEDVPKPVTVG
jgi:hypothetical protein